MRPLHLAPAEGVVLRHALMSYRNRLRHDRLGPPMGDGFEMAAADTLIARLDILSEELLTIDREASFLPASGDQTGDQHSEPVDQ